MMEIESLRELISAFKELGGEAKEGFIWYLIITYLPGYVLGLTWTVAGIMAVFRLLRLMGGLLASEKLRQAAGVSVCWSESELSKACDYLRKGTWRA